MYEYLEYVGRKKYETFHKKEEVKLESFGNGASFWFISENFNVELIWVDTIRFFQTEIVKKNNNPGFQYEYF